MISNNFPKLYLIGDSNIQKAFGNTGFATSLQEDYVRKCDIINRGFSGYTSKDLCTILPKLLDKDNSSQSIKIATILLGSNDSVSKSLDKRYTPITIYKKCLEKIIQELKGRGISKIVLISPPPVDVKKWKAYAFENYGSVGGFQENSENTKEYAEVCREIAREQNDLLFVDLYQNLNQLENWKDMFYDGLHFNETGHQLVYQKLKEKISPIMDQLPMVFPDWLDIDQDNLEKSLLG